MAYAFCVRPVWASGIKDTDILEGASPLQASW